MPSVINIAVLVELMVPSRKLKKSASTKKAAIWFIWFVSFVWLDQMNQINPRVSPVSLD